MTTKGSQDIAAGFAASAGGGGPEVKIPEGLMKPKAMNKSDEYPLRGAEQSEPADKASQGIAAGDAVGNARFPYESGANFIEGPDPEVRVPEGFMKPVRDGRSDELPRAAASAPITDADTSIVVTGGGALDAGEFKSNDSDKVKIPEAAMKPKQVSSPIADASTVADVSSNVSGGQPLNANGFNLDESDTKIPEGVMKPRITGTFPPPDTSSNIAAGHLTPETAAKIPEGIMKPALSAGQSGDSSSIPAQSQNIAAGQLVDASGH